MRWVWCGFLFSLTHCSGILRQQDQKAAEAAWWVQLGFLRAAKKKKDLEDCIQPTGLKMDHLTELLNPIVSSLRFATHCGPLAPNVSLCF